MLPRMLVGDTTVTHENSEISGKVTDGIFRGLITGSSYVMYGNIRIKSPYIGDTTFIMETDQKIYFVYGTPDTVPVFIDYNKGDNILYIGCIYPKRGFFDEKNTLHICRTFPAQEIPDPQYKELSVFNRYTTRTVSYVVLQEGSLKSVTYNNSTKKAKIAVNIDCKNIELTGMNNLSLRGNPTEIANGLGHLDSLSDMIDYMQKHRLNNYGENLSAYINMRIEMLRIIEGKGKDPAGIPECVVCKENRAQYIMSECSHLCLCENCKDNIGTKCPICRMGSGSIHRVYW